MGVSVDPTEMCEDRVTLQNCPKLEGKGWIFLCPHHVCRLHREREALGRAALCTWDNPLRRLERGGSSVSSTLSSWKNTSV